MPLATSFNSISSISKSSLNNVNIEVISGASSSSATYSRVWNYRYLRGGGLTGTFHIYGTGAFDIVLLGGGGAGGGRVSSNIPRAGGGGGAGGFVTINDLSISNGYAYAEATTGSGGVGAIGTRVSGGDTTVTFYTDSTKETIIQTITAPGGGGGGYATSVRGDRIVGGSQGSNGGGGGVTLPFAGGTVSGSHSGYDFLNIDSNYRDFSTGYTINSGLNGGQGGYSTNQATTPYAAGGGGGGLWDGTSFGSTFTMKPYPGTFISDSNYLYPIFGAEVIVAAGGEGAKSLSNYSGETTPGYGNGGGGRGGNSGVTTSGAGLNGTGGAFAFIYAR